MQPDEQIREDAVDWAVRTGDPHFDDWDGFTAWLEQDEAHAGAYDQVAGAIADAAEAAGSGRVAANDDAPNPHRGSRRWFGGALAAALAMVAMFGFWSREGGTYAVETAPGEMQVVTLEDGGTVALAGGSRLILNEDDARFARLDQGRALFTIIHDEADPFVLEAGGHRLLDAGTVFDVRLGERALTVGVAEGAVVFDPARQAVRIAPGEVLQADLVSGEVALAAIAPEQVGEWREGRLTFEEAPLAEIAADLTAATGVQFSAAPSSADHRISGSLLVDPIRESPASLGPLLGLAVRQTGDEWTIEAR